MAEYKDFEELEKRRDGLWWLAWVVILALGLGIFFTMTPEAVMEKIAYQFPLARTTLWVLRSGLLLLLALFIAYTFLTERTNHAMLKEILKKNVSAELYRELAATDDLTGLYNRRKFYDFLQDELERAKRYDHPLSIIMVDVDNFKQYNDLNGHLEGDEVLKRLSFLLKENLRSPDIPCRYGGEEFLIILPHTAKERALFVAERLRRVIQETTFLWQGAMIAGKITISGGVISYPEDGINPIELVDRVDKALYEAKRRGKNHVFSL